MCLRVEHIVRTSGVDCEKTEGLLKHYSASGELFSWSSKIDVVISYPLRSFDLIPRSAMSAGNNSAVRFVSIKLHATLSSSLQGKKLERRRIILNFSPNNSRAHCFAPFAIEKVDTSFLCVVFVSDFLVVFLYLNYSVGGKASGLKALKIYKKGYLDTLFIKIYKQADM